MLGFEGSFRLHCLLFRLIFQGNFLELSADCQDAQGISVDAVTRHGRMPNLPALAPNQIGRAARF
jgi:hypothetical protein